MAISQLWIASDNSRYQLFALVYCCRKFSSIRVLHVNPVWADILQIITPYDKIQLNSQHLSPKRANAGKHFSILVVIIFINMNQLYVHKYHGSNIRKEIETYIRGANHNWFGSYVCTSSGRLSIIRFIFIGVLDSSTDLRWLYNERFSFSLTRVYQQHGYKSFYLVSRRIHIV